MIVAVDSNLGSSADFTRKDEHLLIVGRVTLYHFGEPGVG